MPKTRVLVQSCAVSRVADLEDFVAFRRLGRVDEIDDDDAANIARSWRAISTAASLLTWKIVSLQGRTVTGVLAVDVDDRQGALCGR